MIMYLKNVGIAVFWMSVLVLILYFVVGCAETEIVTENQIPQSIIQDSNYVGRLSKHPERKRIGYYYYNTKNLHFYICDSDSYLEDIELSSVKWKYITLQRLIDRVNKRR